MVSGHVPVPEQPPDQPVNVDPGAATAVSVTEAPSSNCAEHVEPQSIPDGTEVTVPDPVPAFDTVAVFFTPVTVTRELCARPAALAATTA
jgi:hypothetical protein